MLDSLRPDGMLDYRRPDGILDSRRLDGMLDFCRPDEMLDLDKPYGMLDFSHAIRHSKFGATNWARKGTYMCLSLHLLFKVHVGLFWENPRFSETKKEPQRSHESFGGSIASRSLICVGKQRIWYSVGTPLLWRFGRFAVPLGSCQIRFHPVPFDGSYCDSCASWKQLPAGPYRYGGLTPMDPHDCFTHSD